MKTRMFIFGAAALVIVTATVLLFRFVLKPKPQPTADVLASAPNLLSDDARPEVRCKPLSFDKELGPEWTLKGTTDGEDEDPDDIVTQRTAGACGGKGSSLMIGPFKTEKSGKYTVSRKVALQKGRLYLDGWLKLHTAATNEIAGARASITFIFLNSADQPVGEFHSCVNSGFPDVEGKKLDNGVVDTLAQNDKTDWLQMKRHALQELEKDGLKIGTDVSKLEVVLSLEISGAAEASAYFDDLVVKQAAE
jgi:hypothetical protein